VHACQLFVAALGASSYTYAEATATQSLPDWIGFLRMGNLDWAIPAPLEKGARSG
jgi:transposase